MENTFEICLCGKGEDDFGNCNDDINFYVIKVPYAHQEGSSSSSSSSTRKKKEEKKVEHLIPVSVQKAETCNHFAVLDGKLYFVANDLSMDAPIRTSENSFCREVWTLDLACAEEGWSRAPRLKTGRCNPHTIVLGGKLYVLGGFELRKNTGDRFHWIEVFDPIKRKWEPLPNPRFSIRSDLVFTASLEDNQMILVATISSDGEIAQIYGYDVGTCVWTKLLADCKMGFHYRVARAIRAFETEYLDFGSFITAGSTLYWASNREEDDSICRISAFDLVSQKCYEESLHAASIFGRQERWDSVRPDLLNLPDGNFCLILQSRSMKRRKKGRRIFYAHYIYCVVLKVDKEEEEEEEEEEEYEEEEEDDDDYKHGLRVSILSVHKYFVDDWIPLLESVLVDERSYTSKKKKLKSSNEWPSLRACNLLENLKK